MGTNKKKFILVYPETHEHLGLFKDLADDPDVEMIVARQKIPRNRMIKIIKRIHLSWTINKHLSLPFKRIWYEKISLNVPSEVQCCIIVVDGALKMIKPSYLNALFHKEKVRGVLILVNSMDAQSIAILETRKIIPQVRWDDIYTFDPRDAEKYHFKNLGCCYYSMHSLENIEDRYTGGKKSKVYFTGTIKGGRENLVISVFEKLHDASVETNFNVMVAGERRLKKNRHADIINYYSGGWIPYERVLADVINSDVILEVLQKGQNGPSLRYYEAVCYNKCLLTNNPNIMSLPYYDGRYMKVFRDAGDIDIDWIKSGLHPDYCYKGDFSPEYLLNVVKGEDIYE